MSSLWNKCPQVLYMFQFHIHSPTFSFQSIIENYSAEEVVVKHMWGPDCGLMKNQNAMVEVLGLAYLYDNKLCGKNIVIPNVAHMVTADYTDPSAREAFQIVFQSGCNQHMLIQVYAHFTHTDTNTHAMSF